MQNTTFTIWVVWCTVASQYNSQFSSREANREMKRRESLLSTHYAIDKAIKVFKLIVFSLENRFFGVFSLVSSLAAPLIVNRMLCILRTDCSSSVHCSLNEFRCDELDSLVEKGQFGSADGSEWREFTWDDISDQFTFHNIPLLLQKTTLHL